MTTNIEFDAVSNSWDEHTNAGENHISTGVQVAQAANGKAASEPVPVDAGSGAPATNQPAADAKAPASNAPASNANAPTGNAPATNAAASNVPHEYVVQAGNVVKLPANVSIDDIKVDGHNLVLVQPDGSEIIIKDGALNVPTFILGDVEVPRVALIAALEASHVDVAFGADGSISASGNGSTSSAGGNFDQPAGGIGNGFGLSPLLPPTDLAFGQPEHRDLFPGLAQPNRAPEIDVTPTSPNPSDGFNIVDESGLPTGSNPSDAAIHATGTIHMTDPDGAGDLKTLTVGLGGSTQTVNISDITGANSQTFNFTSGGAHGTLTITGYNAATGNATYTYTLTNPVHDATPNNGADTVSPGDTFNLTVTDGSGATGTANLVIDIKDDVPHAVADTSGIAAGAASASGNVLVTDGSGDHQDTFGADGAASGGGVVGVAAGNTGLDLNNAGTLGGTGVAGDHGTLILGADGHYTYTLNPNDAAVNNLPKGQTLTDTFTYTIADGDGDLSHTTLTVTITGSNHTPEIDVTPTSPNPADGFNIVDEAGLSNGSSPSVPATQATGTIHLADTDGAGDLQTLTVSLGGSTQTVNISAITGGSSQTFNFTSGSAHGTLTISGYDAATGNATYTYTLTKPVTEAPANNGTDTVSPGDTFTLTVTDASNTTGTASLNIDIKDDVPHAVADDGAIAVGGPQATGNVESNDTPGADGYAAGGGVVGVEKGTTAGGANAGVGASVTGDHGTLILGANGGYTYTLDPNDAAVKNLPKGSTLTDTFTYTIKDGDGDLSHTTLTVTITGTNHTPTIDVTPTNPNPGDGYNIVNEAGLSNGSSPSVPATQATGTIHLADTDGAGDLQTLTVSLGGSTQTVNISAITGGSSQTFNFTSGSAHGTLTISGYDAATGNATYTYTLTKPVTEAPANNGTDTVSPGDTFTLTVTDASNTTGTASLNIDIKDDVPHAVADTNTGIEGATLNVSAANGVLHNDISGADGYAAGGGVVGVRTAGAGNDTTTPVTTGVSTNIVGAYGTLTLYADGSYKYVGTPNVVPPAGATDTFVYTIKDGDGDLSTTTLKINLTDSGITASANEAQVNEAGLPTGSHAGDGSNIFTTGQITASSAAGGLTYALTTSATGSHGTLTLNPDGSYTYMLTSPVTESPAANNGTDTVNHADSFGYTVTDANGNTVTGTIYVDVKDDVPTLGSFMSATIPNEIGSVNGLFSLVPGADGIGHFNITGPTIAGISYNTTTAADGTTVLHGMAGATEVFNLTVRPDGTYEFDLITPQASTSVTSSLANLASGSSNWAELADGSVEFSSPSSVNSSTQGFGVGNNFLDKGDTFTMEFHKAGTGIGVDDPASSNPNFVDKVDFTTNKANTGDAVSWTANDTVHNITQSGTAAVDATGHLVIDPTISFNQLVITGITAGESFRLTSASITQTVLPSDQYLQFQVSATDKDGDTTVAQSVNIHVVAGDGSGHFTLTGTAGNDVIAGSSHADTISGGGGKDIVDYSGSLGAISIHLADDGHASGAPAQFNNPAAGTIGGGDATGDTLTGISGLIGGLGDDYLVGNSGDNYLAGGPGNNTLIGGAGNDILVGGSGLNTMTGGTGNDTFVIDPSKLTVHVADVITDYTQGQDVIDLSDLLKSLGANAPTTDQQTGDAVSVTFSNGSAHVMVDNNGTAAGGSMVEVATLSGVGVGSAITILYDHTHTHTTTVT